MLLAETRHHCVDQRKRRQLVVDRKATDEKEEGNKSRSTERSLRRRKMDKVESSEGQMKFWREKV